MPKKNSGKKHPISAPVKAAPVKVAPTDPIKEIEVKDPIVIEPSLTDIKKAVETDPKSATDTKKEEGGVPNYQWFRGQKIPLEDSKKVDE